MTDETDDILLPSERDRLEEQVKKEIEAEQKADARTKLKDQLKKKYRQQTGIEEGVEEVYIDLAQHADRITIDGVSYMQGATVTVKKSLAIELRHIMQATFEHQSEIDGHPKRYYRERNIRISPHGQVNTSQLLRV